MTARSDRIAVDGNPPSPVRGTRACRHGGLARRIPTPLGKNMSGISPNASTTGLWWRHRPRPRWGAMAPEGDRNHHGRWSPDLVAELGRVF